MRCATLQRRMCMFNLFQNIITSIINTIHSETKHAYDTQLNVGTVILGAFVRKMEYFQGTETR